MKSKTTPSATSIAPSPNEVCTLLIAGRRHPEVLGPSRVLEDDALDEIGNVLAAIGDRFELLVDGLQLDQLADVVLFAEQPRHRRAHDAVGIGLEAVDLLAGLDRRLGHLRLADLGKERDGMLNPLTAPGAQVAEAQ